MPTTASAVSCRWAAERRVIARIEASDRGTDSRFIVTNLRGAPQWLYEVAYCARGQAENLVKAHKLHLASDRTSCSKATANQFRLVLHTAAYWLLDTLRGLAPKRSFWRAAQFDTVRLMLIKVAGRVTELATRIKLALPSSYPYRNSPPCSPPVLQGRPEPRGGVPPPSPSLATTSPGSSRRRRHGSARLSPSRPRLSAPLR